MKDFGEIRMIKISFVLLLFGLSLANATKVQMRIVHDTANYGYFANNAAETEGLQLVLRATPSNFSGPILLRKLSGHCFNITLDRYQYSLCPFHNITQREVTMRWNSYQGVLGIWSHWKIVNNTFRSMVYTLGDSCGDIDRSVEVILECGSKHALLNVTEPGRCRYSATFATKYVCHPDALLVYPRMAPELQKEWDHYWTYYKNGYSTEKGYKISLEKLFIKAGFTNSISEPKIANESSKAPVALTDAFTDLHMCNKEYEELKKELSQMREEIDALKILLDLNKTLNRTMKGSPS